MDESRMQNTIRELSQSPAFTWFAGALCKGPGLYLAPFPTGFGKSYAFTWLMTLFAGGMRREDLLSVLPELSGKKEETPVARILFVSPQIRDCHDAYRKIKERLPDLRPGEVLYIRSTEDTLRDLKLRSSRKTYEAWLKKLTDQLCRGKQGDRSHVLKASLDRLIHVYESFSSQQGDPEAVDYFREELNRSLTDFGKEFRDLMHQDPAIKEACRAASGEERTSSADAGTILRKYILQPGSDYAPIMDFFPAIRRSTARVILMTDRMFACPVKDPVTSGGTAWYEEFTGGGNLIFLDESDRVKADITDSILRTRAKDPDDILHNLICNGPCQDLPGVTRKLL